LNTIITTPTETWIREAISTCRSQFLVSSPFVTNIFCEIVSTLPRTVERTLLTRTDIRDFAVGASDLEALYTLAGMGTNVLSAPRLHAKVYIVDSSHALVTSANATSAGLRSNRECGLSVEDPRIIRQLSDQLLSGFGQPDGVSKWTAALLAGLRKPTAAMKDVLPPIPPSQVMEPNLAKVKLAAIADEERLLSSLSGWKKLVLKEIIRLPRDDFNLDAVYAACRPAAAKEYPTNRFVDDKIRQQLQYLRDIGLVEFLGNGVYRRLVGPPT
jgi:hypothetical protein